MKIFASGVALMALTGAAFANNPNVDTSVPADPAAEESNPWLKLVQSEDVTMTIFGRIQNDWTWATGDDPPYDTTDGVEFRRARLGAKGTLFDLVDYKAEYDFAGGDVDFKDVYMGTKFSGGGALRIGHFKEPVSLEEQTSSRFITFGERSVMNALVPGRNTGAGFFGNTEGKNVGYAFGVFRDTNDFGDDNNTSGTAEDDSEYAFTGRGFWTPVYEEEGASVVHVGASGSYRQTDDGMVRFRTRPENHLMNRPIDTGQITGDDWYLYNFEGAWVEGPFSLQGEYTMVTVDYDSGSDPDFCGYYGEASYYLTGEHRNYKHGQGKFDRVKPMTNVTRDDWGGGAWQGAVRYSSLDLDDGPGNGSIENITVGLKWILNPNSRIVLNYIHSEVDDQSPDGNADIFLVRFQVDF